MSESVIVSISISYHQSLDSTQQGQFYANVNVVESYTDIRVHVPNKVGLKNGLEAIKSCCKGLKIVCKYRTANK